MWKEFEKLSLSRAMTLATLVPIVAMCILAGILAKKAATNYSDLARMHALVSLSVNISELVHEQQRERGATAIFLASDGKQFIEELTFQRTATDERSAIFVNAASEIDFSGYDETIQKEIDALGRSISLTADLRDRIDSVEASSAEAINYYTDLNGRMVGFIANIANIISEPSVISHIVAFSNFLEGKDLAGVERAIGSAGFTSGQFSPRLKYRFRALIDAQNTYSKFFRIYASKTHQLSFDDILKSPVSLEVQRMRDVVINSRGPEDILKIESPYWFRTITRKIDALKVIEENISTDLLRTSREIRDAVVPRILIGTALVLSLIIVVLVFSSCMVLAVHRAFRPVVSAMRRLAQGDINVDLPMNGGKEIGEMIDALKIFRKNALQQKIDNESRMKRAQAIREMADEFEKKFEGDRRSKITIKSTNKNDVQRADDKIEQL